MSRASMDEPDIKSPPAQTEVQGHKDTPTLFAAEGQAAVKDETAVTAGSENTAGGPEPDIRIRLYSEAEKRPSAESQDRTLYMTYPVETLEEMGENGDVMALDVLHEIYYRDAKFEQGDLVMEKAAMFGSIEALFALGGTMASFAEGLAMGERKPSPETRSKLFKGMAWLKVGIQRGDPYARQEFDAFMAKRSLNLTDEDLAVIETKAHAFYDRLIRERQRRGLGEFDQ